jgi:hypothetical protein
VSLEHVDTSPCTFMCNFCRPMRILNWLALMSVFERSDHHVIPCPRKRDATIIHLSSYYDEGGAYLSSRCYKKWGRCEGTHRRSTCSEFVVRNCSSASNPADCSHSWSACI